MTSKSLRSLKLMAACAFLALAAVCPTAAQARRATRAKAPAAKTMGTTAPKVTVIDIEGLKKLVKPTGTKPLMINFWATWCDPCREEFPDLVKLNTQYKGKIDFVTVSLDELADLDTAVPKFLSQMKASMPAYLLHTTDDDAAIAVVSPEWAGNLPLTIIYKPNGEVFYLRKGKIHMEDVTDALDKFLATASAP